MLVRERLDELYLSVSLLYTSKYIQDELNQQKNVITSQKRIA